MANRTQLYNSTLLSSDPRELAANVESEGGEVIECAEASYTIPIPWLCCFRPEDMRKVEASFGDEEDEEAEDDEVIEIEQPCTTVAQAIVNLEASLPLFVRIAGDERVGLAYWQQAIDGLKSLPLPYLSINAEEVALMGDDHEEYSESIRRALAGDVSAIADLVDLSAYDEKVAPYTLEEFDSITGERDETRNANAIALHSGIFIDPAEAD